VIEAECTGCDLCIPVCPVDCIYIKPITETINTWKWPSPEVNTYINAQKELS